MSMDLAEKKRQRPRQGSLRRPRPIGRDRVVFSRGRACRCYALACGRGTHEFARPLARPLRSGCMRNLLFGKLDALDGAAIGGFGVQIGRAFAKPLADNETVLLENRATVISVTGRPDGYRADLLPHNLKVIGSNPIPATTDPGDTKSPGSQPPKGGRASFSPRQSTGPGLDRPRVRSDLCRKATTSHVRTSRPTDRFLHGRNGATVDDILGSGD
jgi:hypothetical protein